MSLSLESLAYTRICNVLQISPASPQESIVALSMNPKVAQEECQAEAHAIMQTGILFVLDQETTQILVNSEATFPVGPMPLPPLPFKRMMIEYRGDDLPALLEIEAGVGLLLVMLYEMVEGTRWMVTLATLPPTSDPKTLEASDFIFMAFEVTENTVTRPGRTVPYDDLDDALRFLIVNSAHLCVADGISRTLTGFPRAERRRTLRHAPRFTIPTTYMVRIAPARVIPGNSDREYHCRWMVRGHWRHTRTRKVWVRPYIKGPVGAPWKGRPVYVA